MGIGENHAGGGHPIQVRRGDLAVGVQALHVAVAEVVARMKTMFGRTAGPLRGFAQIEIRPVSRTKVVSSLNVLLEVRGSKSVRGWPRATGCLHDRKARRCRSSGELPG